MREVEEERNKKYFRLMKIIPKLHQALHDLNAAKLKTAIRLR